MGATATYWGTSDEGGTTLELYVRSLSPRGCRGCQAAVLDRLERLEADGVIDGYDVYVWGDGLCPASVAAETSRGERIVERIERFERWAREAGTSLDALRRTEVRSSFTDAVHTRIEFPALLLAEFDGERLRQVTPHTDAGTTRTVDDRLSALERVGADVDPRSGTVRPTIASDRAGE